MVAGVAHQPYVGETFTAAAGGSAEWRRGSERRTLRTRRCPTVGDAVVACTDPRMFRTADERAAFDRVADRARLTRWGGDCYAYCLLAMGLIDIVIEASLHAYDVQALMPIVEAAGGDDHHLGRRALRRRRIGGRLRRSRAACARPGTAGVAVRLTRCPGVGPGGHAPGDGASAECR